MKRTCAVDENKLGSDVTMDNFFMSVVTSSPEKAVKMLRAC